MLEDFFSKFNWSNSGVVTVTLLLSFCGTGCVSRDGVRAMPDQPSPISRTGSEYCGTACVSRDGIPGIPSQPSLTKRPDSEYCGTAFVSRNGIPGIPSQPRETKKPKQIVQPTPRQLQAVGAGTGFFVSETGHKVTNNHVVEQCESIKFISKGAELPAVLLARDKVNDVALPKAELTPPGVLHVGEEKAELLERIFVAGFPFGSLVSSSLKVTSGIVSSLAGIDDNYSNIQIDAAIQQGNSGGPIANEKGNVIAIAVGKLSTKYFLSRYGTVPEGSNFGVKGTVVGNLLEANQVEVAAPNRASVETQVLSKSLTDSTINLTCMGFPGPRAVEGKAGIQ